MRKTDHDSFDTLVAPHLQALYRYAYRLVRSVPDAQDLVQDTCEAALANIDSLADADSPRSWLLRVQHNRFIDACRRRGRSPVTDAREPHDVEGLAIDFAHPEQLLQQAQDAQLLEQAFLQLDEVARTLLSLRAEGHDLPAIEAITGIERSVLSNRLYRARLRLAGLMTDLNRTANTNHKTGSAQ